MFTRLRATYHEYHPQLWLMAAGLLISSVGGSMIWPFLMIYVSEKLALSLSTVATLITLNASCGLLASFIGGAVADKLGRKPVMIISLTITGIGYFFLSQATTFMQFAVLMGVMGAANPLYQVGSDATLADLIPPEKRTNAYAIMRMVNNAGIAIGPAMGGFLADISYSYAFLGAAGGMLIYSFLLLFRARETLARADHPAQPVSESFGGYGRVLKDRGFIAFALLMGLGLIAPSVVWTLMGVYVKQNYGLAENLYGWLPTTNALMCVFVQFFVTRIFRPYRSLSVATIGMLTYAMGVGSFALMRSFWGFWLGMVIMTLGELTLLPTASKYIADLAPTDMRGRYMSFYWFAWGIARAAAPLIGGTLNDNISPRSIWIGGGMIALASTAGLFILSNRLRVRRTREAVNPE